MGSLNFALISSNDDLPHGCLGGKLRLLLQVAHRVPRVEDDLSAELLLDAGHDSQQRALAGSVQTDHADFRAVEVREGDVLDDGLLVVALADADHRVDDLVRFLVPRHYDTAFAMISTIASVIQVHLGDGRYHASSNGVHLFHPGWNR
jgi:hypothetical protein